jgi:transcriptional regulator with XRE-family HTH domain
MLAATTVDQPQPYTWGLMAGRPATKDAPLFGQRLAALRKERGLSQETLAARLGTTRAAIVYYERKAGNPTLDFIQHCAEFFDVSVSDLIESAQQNSKPGRKSRLQKQIEEIQQLPPSKQRFVSDFLNTFLRQNQTS